MKKIICLIMCVCILFGLTACSGEKEVQKVTMKEGKPAAVGDVFKLPEIKRSSDSAPIIVGFTKQAGLEDSVIITGEGFLAEGTKAYVFSQTTKDNAKTQEADITVADDITMTVNISKNLDYGMYGIYVENTNGTSNMVLINKPNIWWVGLNGAAVGDSVSIYGENLTSDNGDKSNIFLVTEGKYCACEITYADSYKITFTVPECVEAGQSYEILLHSGHGGEEGFATAPEKLIVYDELPTQSTGKKINVTDFKDKKLGDDYAPCIQAAVDAASDGDIIYFPKGTYNCASVIKVSKQLHFEGAGDDKTKIVLKEEMTEFLFQLTTGPCEFEGIYFKHIKENAKITAGFIQIRADAFASDVYTLYVHDCTFKQHVNKDYRSLCAPIVTINTYGVVVENNKYDSTAMIATRESEKVFVRNNDYKGVLYCGQYYHQNSIFLVNSNMFDISSNNIESKDYDTSRTLSPDDYTVGRSIAIQGFGKNLYISNNKIDVCGLPDDNAGEQIMLENMSYKYSGTAVAYTENTITLPSDSSIQVTSSDIITVVKGKGVTQYRKAQKSNGKTITLSEPWDIIPDKDSHILITRCFDRVVISNNYMDGYKNYREDAGATTGVQAYGNVIEMYITGNTFKNMPFGICISPHHKVYNAGELPAINGLYWSNIDNNNFEDCAIGVRYLMATQDSKEEIPLYTDFGMAFRRNTFKNMLKFTELTNDLAIAGKGGIGFYVGTSDIYDMGAPSPTWAGAWIYGNLIENSVFDNSEAADIYLYKHQGKTILRNNKSVSGDVSVKYEKGAEKAIVSK